ncbi:MAG: hypothetical protein HQM04_04640 [Magnetococcales bacterium]|nr:hypothetical protein [Magnetococcales bacterium]MBF0114313.1 hypothetical protein [Magnetococcales bacterium]
MKNVSLFALLLLGLSLSAPAFGHDSSGRRHHHGKKQHRPYSDEAALRAFRSTHPCPSTGSLYGRCPGFVVVKYGKAHIPANFHWQRR